MRTQKTFKPNGRTLDLQGRRRRSRGGPPGVVPALPLAGAPAPLYPPALLTNVAHLLSQPLTALRGSLELSLLTAQGAGELRLGIQEALEQGEEITRRISLLRELAEAQSAPREAEPVWVGEVLAAIVEDLRPLAEAREVRVELHPTEIVQVWAARRRFQRALTRILYCIIQREPRGGSVNIELLQTGAHSCLEVRSTQAAPVLPSPEPQVVFRPVTPSLDAIKESRDLEWLIATQLIRSMGGNILADGPLPQASHCRIYLPLAGLALSGDSKSSVSRSAGP